jgi:hypothetical protein
VQGGTAGTTTGVYYPASNQVALATNGTLALVVNSSQAVGVGISNPTTKLHVAGGVVRSSNTANTTYCELQNDGIYGGGNLYILAPASSGIYTYANNTLSTTLSTAGNLTFNQSNAGIVFNNSSASVASTLNDYETGTWSPAITGASSYGQRIGTYTKIGNMVYAMFILVGPIGGSPSGNTINGLPFISSSSLGTLRWSGSIANSQNISSGGTALQIEVANSTSSISMYGFNNAAGYGTVNMASGSSGGSWFIQGHVIYQAF